MTQPVETGWCVRQPRPRDTPAWREAVRAGLISPVPGEPPALVVGPSAHVMQRVLFATVAMSVLVLAFLQRPVESLVAIGTALAGIPVYWLFKRGASKSG